MKKIEDSSNLKEKKNFHFVFSGMVKFASRGKFYVVTPLLDYRERDPVLILNPSLRAHELICLNLWRQIQLDTGTGIQDFTHIKVLHLIFILEFYI